MKLNDALENYYTTSGKASDVCRQLGFAGIAIIWIFKAEGGNTVPKEFLLPAVFIVASLAADAMQYVSGTLVWGIFHRWAEKIAARTNDRDPESKAPAWLNWPMIAFFWSKILLLITGYILLLNHLFSILRF